MFWNLIKIFQPQLFRLSWCSLLLIYRVVLSFGVNEPCHLALVQNSEHSSRVLSPEVRLVTRCGGTNVELHCMVEA